MAAKKIAMVEFRGNPTPLKKAVSEIKKEYKGLNKFADGLIKSGMRIATVFTGALTGLVAAFLDEDKAIRKVAAALRTVDTKHTVDSIAGLTGELQQMSTMGNEALMNLSTSLLTAGQVTDENLKPALQAVLDTAAALNKPVEKMGRTFALALAKLPADASTAFTSLEGMGLIMTKLEKERLKAMAESGRMAEVQTILIERLGSKYAGLAKSQAESVAGTIVRIKNNFGDAMENVARAFMKSSGDFLKKAYEFSNWIVSFTEKHGALIARIVKTTAVWGAAVAMVGGVIKAYAMVVTGLKIATLHFKIATASAKVFWVAAGGWLAAIVKLIVKVGAALGAWKAIEWILDDTRRLGIMWKDWLPAVFDLAANWIQHKLAYLGRAIFELMDAIPFTDFSTEVATAQANVDKFARRSAHAASMVGQAWADAKRKLSNNDATASDVLDLGTGLGEVATGATDGGEAAAALGADGEIKAAAGDSGAHPRERQLAQATEFLKERARLTREYADREKELEKQALLDREKQYRQFMDSMIGLAQHKSKNLRRLGATASIADAIIKGKAAVHDVFVGTNAFFAGTPLAPIAPALAAAAAAATAAQSAARISEIKQAAGMQKGGLIEGPITDGDSRLRMLAPGELVIPQKSYKDWESGVRADERARATRDMDGTMDRDVNVRVEMAGEAADILRAESDRRDGLGI